MQFEVREYKERAPRVEAVTFTGEFDVAGLIANFAGATSFEVSRSTGLLLLSFDTVDEVTNEILVTESVSVKVGDVVMKADGKVRSVAANEFNTQFEVARLRGSEFERNAGQPVFGERNFALIDTLAVER